jgi:hypothetical protein
MTTRVEHQLFRDLRQNPDWPLFSQSVFGTDAPKLCSSTIVWTETSEDQATLRRRVGTGLAYQIAVIARQLRLSVFLFIATSTLQPNTAVVKYRGLWRSPMLGSVPLLDKTWPETIVECGARIRIATLAAVPVSEFHWMIQVNESFESAIPILLPTDLSLGEGFHDDLLRAAFPPDGCRPHSDFDWPLFSTLIATLGGISVRRTNEFCMNRVCVDFFGHDNLSEKISRLAAEDDEVTRARVR